MTKTQTVECCVCGYPSSARGVDIHMAMKHRDILNWKKWLVGKDRPLQNTCPICHMFHDDNIRKGYMANRRWLQRSRREYILARTPPGYRGRGERLHLKTLTVPEGTTRILPMFFSDIPGQFHMTVSGKEYTFDVDQGGVRGFHVRKVA